MRSLTNYDLVVGLTASDALEAKIAQCVRKRSLGSGQTFGANQTKLVLYTRLYYKVICNETKINNYLQEWTKLTESASYGHQWCPPV